MNRIEKLNELLKNSPQDCFLWHAKGLEYVKMEDFEQATECFRHVLTHLDERYVGTYYHLAKTLERLGRNEEAMSVYEKGIAVAKQVNDHHARNELQMALDDLTDD